MRAPRTDEFFALCPIHDEKTGSLHVTWRARQAGGGYVLLKCFGCDGVAEDFTEALGLDLSDLFDEPLPEREPMKSVPRRRAGERRGKLGRTPKLLVSPVVVAPLVHDFRDAAVYTYSRPDGELVEQVVRRECACTGERHKTFVQRYWLADKGVWVDKKDRVPGFVPVLYNAAGVRAARSTGELVHVTEGEKDADRLIGLGCVATTNAEGATSFPAVLIEELAGQHLWLHVDRDPAGFRRAVQLWRDVLAADPDTVVELKLPAVSEAKSDVSDHLDAGFDLDQLVSVTAAELEVWVQHELAATRARAVQQAVDQAIAQRDRGDMLLAAEDERRREAKEPEPRAAVLGEVEECRRHAKRWVLETEVRQEALQEAVQSVYAGATQARTSWSFEAMLAAERLLTEMTDAAREVHNLFGVAVPPSLRAPTVEAPEPTEPEAAPPAQTGRVARTGARKRSSVFRVLDGRIVEWVPARPSAKDSAAADDDGAVEDGEKRKDGRFKTLLSMVVRISVREYLEVDDDTAHEPELMGRTPVRQPRTPRQMVAVQLQYEDPASGELMEIRVGADAWRDHSWIDTLPGAPDYDHRRAGLDQLQRAVVAISDDVVDRVLHMSTGWRKLDDGRMGFVHGRGMITADGHEPAGVQLSGATRRYDWPDPVVDPRVLREAWLSSGWAMVQQVPARITAPVLGAVFRSVISHNPWVVALIGPPGSYKTSVASQAMQFFGEMWDRDRPSSSMSGNGDTLNAMRVKLRHAKDVLYWMDDFAPTKSWLEAQKLLEECARLIHNSEERQRSSRDGLSVSDGSRPRASGLMTSEVMPRPGSGSERILVVPIMKQDVDTRRLFPLSDQQHRHRRALVMASFVSWLAANHQERYERYELLEGQIGAQLAQNGGSVRQSAALASVQVGWIALLEFLATVGAISADEQNQALTLVRDALEEAGEAAINPDIPRSTGERVRELLGYALRQGIAYVDDVRSGDCPPWPLGRQLGWRRTVMEGRGADQAQQVRFDRMGVPLGYVRHDPNGKETDGRVLMCDSTQLEAVIRAAASTQAEKLEIDRNTACKALAEAGVLLTERSGGIIRYTKKCEIYAEDVSRRMTVLKLDSIITGLGDDDDNDPARPDRPDDDGDTGSSAGMVGGHGVDVVGAGVHTEDAGVNHGAGREPDQLPDPAQEGDMETVASTAWTDRDGVIGWTDTDRDGSSAPCIMCGIRCAITMEGGLRLHIPCWMRSTAAERAAAQQQPSEPHNPTPGSTAPARVVESPAPAAPAAVAAVETAPAAGKVRPRDKVFRTAAAVADVDGLWLSDGSMEPWAVPPQHVGDLYEAAVRLQLGTRVTPYATNPGQIWVTEALLGVMGVDPAPMLAATSPETRRAAAEAATKGQALVVDAIAAGYSCGGTDDGDSLGRWTRVWRTGATDDAVWIVLIPAYELHTAPGKDPELPLTGDNPDPATLARRIGRLATELGFAFQMHPGHAGLDLLRALRLKDRERLFRIHDAIPPALWQNTEVDLNWSRVPTEEELQHTYLHAYDRGGSHVAAATGLDLPIGVPQHHEHGRPFDPKVAGYWKIEIPDSWDWRLPNPLDTASHGATYPRWVTTPTLAFAVQQGFEPEPVEAYTWPEYFRVLDPWYERIRDARTALDTDDPDDQVARDQLKQIYTRTLGMFGSRNYLQGKPMYQPEWREFIVAKANMNVLRRIVTIGQEHDLWPVAVLKDTVLYTSNEPDPIKAWPGGARWFGRGMGQYKWEGSALLADHAQYLTGRGYSGKVHLTKDDLA